MKKFTLLLFSLLIVSTLAIAQKKLCIQKINGEKIEFVASDVAYIDFGDTQTEPDDAPVFDYSAKPFSVGEDKTVIFSKGNLQYHPANNEWRFAPSQLDYVGEENINISSNYNGWIDLFGWGTGNNPTNSSEENEDYPTFIDWGVNKIGDYEPNTWRTLSNDEWEYLISGRENAMNLMGVAQVEGVNGLILLPDNWACPKDVTFKTGFYIHTCVDCYGLYQTLTASDWSVLEMFGAIFLPIAGYRYGSEVAAIKNIGNYWSANEDEDPFMFCFYISSSDAYMFFDNKTNGQSVRLVRDK